ncbi:hypothetical protein HanRHA438_Chr04g0152261 [Helianthus annuus]|nr:hypothetical protein HanRHA438_Chr04g0152261 [Helianthus annuus]
MRAEPYPYLVPKTLSSFKGLCVGRAHIRVTIITHRSTTNTNGSSLQPFSVRQVSAQPIPTMINRARDKLYKWTVTCSQSACAIHYSMIFTHN